MRELWTPEVIPHASLCVQADIVQRVATSREFTYIVVFYETGEQWEHCIVYFKMFAAEARETEKIPSARSV